MERVESTTMGRREFERCVADADRFRSGAGQVLREIWDSDKVNFRRDQRKNGKEFCRIGNSTLTR